MRDVGQVYGATSTGVESQPQSTFSASVSRSPQSLGLSQRLVVFAILFLAEWAPITYFVHKDRGAGALLQIAVAFSSFFLAIAFIRSKDSLQAFSAKLKQTPIRWSLLAAHLVALIAFLGLSRIPNGNTASALAIAALWYVTGASAILLSACAFVPPKLAFEFGRNTGYAWIYALAAAFVSWRVVESWIGTAWNPAWSFSWKPATDLTFSLVRVLLRPFVPHLVANQATLTIGTPGFTIVILPWCAGFEGTALMLVFSVAWLAYFRREFRFPQALLLVPAGMLVIWIANAVRIATLVLIGIAGAPSIAMGGFHSQAGWIAFNCVALGFVVLTRRLTWFTTAREEQPGAMVHNPTAAFLLPFLAILGAAMISRAAAGSFEWLYPLRFVAAVAALWFFRLEYRRLDWRFSGLSVLAGAAVFGIWLGLDLTTGIRSTGTLAAGVASLPLLARIAWLVFRTVAAVTTVPIAEELAFRGFLIRRISSADFESLNPRHYTYLALFLSSLAFGLLHGDRWLAGTLAGVIYAAVFLRRGRIGDAVVAHATTNALIAVSVLLFGRWDLW